MQPDGGAVAATRDPLETRDVASLWIGTAGQPVMGVKIAIQPDKVVHPNGKLQSFSTRWAELAQAKNIEVVPVDVFSGDAMGCISGCDAFMWRCPSSAHIRAYAKRFLYALEAGSGMPVFPSLKSSWYFEDKLAQRYFFNAADIPCARTDIFWTREAAEQFCERATYPFVLKLAGGHQSANVRLVRNRREAKFYVEELFGHGVASLGYCPASRLRLLLRRLRAAAQTLEGHNPYVPSVDAELHYGYFYAQEFLPGNDFEISVIIVGNRAFAVRRFIQPGDFRTRGSSGRMDWSPEQIGEDAIRLAFHTARKLGAQTVALDILHRDREPVVMELTANYASWVVRNCPGHWVLHGEPQSGSLEWAEGRTRAADAIFEDFLDELTLSEPIRHHGTTQVLQG
jgi:glutathione synthase/RimK-type ligase-like ATP-grasp enzyme